MPKNIQRAPNVYNIPTHLTGIYIVGPSSSGKTTLCKALISRLHLPSNQHISEVARTVMRSSSFTRNQVDRLEMQRAILNAQVAAENDARSQNSVATAENPQGNLFLLCDRSAIDPLVFASLSPTEATGAEILAESDELQAILPIYRRALFILLHPVKEWFEDDGVRSLADPSGYPRAFKHYMDQFEIKYYELDDSLKALDDRVNAVLGWAGITYNHIIEISRLQNSLRVLSSTQKQLQDAMGSEAVPDADLQQAFQENLEVIGSQEERIVMLRKALEAQGAAIADNPHYQVQSQAISSSAAAPHEATSVSTTGGTPEQTTNQDGDSEGVYL
ncbi:hypothetical protein FRC11_014383 [Ceratobasidium sp. 423]|nr:hypothetical protein FRC11_014383 [Ceratobasidium sp. 423]